MRCSFPQRPQQLHMRNHGALWEIIQHFINQSYLHQAYHPLTLRAFIEQALHHATPLGQGIPNNWPMDSDLGGPLFQECPSPKALPYTFVSGDPTKPVPARLGEP